MKKILVTCIGLIALVSCNIKNSEEYKQMQAQRDSLMQVSAKSNAELTEMMTIINDVEENFSQIKEAEKYLAIESKGKTEMTGDTKTRVRENFDMVQNIIQKNKEEISKLNQRLKSSSGNAAGLQKTIERLNKELEEKVTSIEGLRTSLATRDSQIAGLKISIKSLSDDVTQLASKAETQAVKIDEQDLELNAGYYIFGTSKELKDSKVVSGSFFTSNKIIKESVEKSNFIKVDIRKNKELSVFSKKAKILSDHPKDSYEITKDAKGNSIIKIIDYTKFWSVTRFLVVEV